MWERITQLVSTNQFFAGGAILGLIAAVAAYGRMLFRTAIYHARFLFFCQCEFETAYDFESINWLSHWLAKQSANKKSKRVMIRAWGPDQIPEFTPAPGRHVFKWRNKWVILARTSAQQQNGHYNQRNENWTLWLRGNRDDLDAFIQECRDAYRSATTDLVRVRVANGYLWKEIFKPRRDLSTIMLPTSLSQELLDEMSTFWNSRDAYANRGRPWRRGYLLQGPPGNGKSSYVVAIAGYFNKPLYMLNLSTVRSGASLVNFLLDIPSDVVLVLEDLDRDLESVCSVKAESEREDFMDNDEPRTALPSGSGDAVNLQVLLNALDGILASEGRLLFVTTNHPERIDPVLMRPGRIDRTVTFEPSYEQYANLYKLFFPDAPEDQIEQFADSIPAETCMAFVQDYLIRHEAESLQHLDEFQSDKVRALAITDGREQTVEAMYG